MIHKINTYLKDSYRKIKRDHLNLNNLILTLAILIALSWTWNSIAVMQQNYDLQKLVNTKKQQLVLEKLRVDTLELESNYYNTIEYQEMAVRERLNKGLAGEKLLIVKSTDMPITPTKRQIKRKTTTNIEEWVNFLFSKPHQ